MKQVNTERQQLSARLPRQLPANTIKEIASPTQQKHVNKNIKSAPNRVDKIAGENQRQSPLRRLQTDLGDLDSHRSLSTCPTYSSLSRHSPETRECATQITTLTPTGILEDSQEILNDSLLPIVDSPVLLVDEVEPMPISSGFSYSPYRSGNPTAQRVVPPQIITRARQTYYDQFRDTQRDNNQNGTNVSFKKKQNAKATRPTAVKQPPRSDISSLPPRRPAKTIPKVPKNDPPPNNVRRVPPKEPVVKSASPPPEKRRAEPVHTNGTAHPSPKYLTSPPGSEDLGRKPVRLATKHHNAYYPPSPSPVYYQKSAPVPRNASERPRRMRVANSEYVIERRRQPSSDHVYDDYRTDSPVERTRPQRRARVVREAPYQEDDDVYYVEPAPTRRAPAVRRAPPTEYVYVDETPPQHHSRHRRAPPARRPEVVYVDEDQPIEYEDDYIYVDEDGNEVDINNERNRSPQYVQYIYDDEKDRRRSHKQKVVYVDDDSSTNHGRNRKISKHPSSTRIVYE